MACCGWGDVLCSIQAVHCKENERGHVPRASLAQVGGTDPAGGRAPMARVRKRYSTDLMALSVVGWGSIARGARLRWAASLELLTARGKYSRK
jgi:hypothetical protein